MYSLVRDGKGKAVSVLPGDTFEFPTLSDEPVKVAIKRGLVAA
ncbi:hypothetical protein KIPB_000253, partial [Kipferlia bialata]|eukprot:g253.t1